MFTYFLYNIPHALREPGYHSWYSDWLRTGWSGVRTPTDFSLLQKPSRAAPDSHSAVPSWIWPPTPIQYWGWEWVNTFLPPPYASMTLSGAVLPFKLSHPPEIWIAHVLTQNDSTNRIQWLLLPFWSTRTICEKVGWVAPLEGSGNYTCATCFGVTKNKNLRLPTECIVMWSSE